ncbi:hypothetical protein [Butyrivibrio sp. MC2013]|uniref:hypothetical protein n=1 Tax=Butyrivibrio sp. MC2013 TaxID=1280686 RepID=UPI0003F9E2E3|nr:hypothetical protein [Butyrivibrio sp. MC2013]
MKLKIFYGIVVLLIMIYLLTDDFGRGIKDSQGYFQALDTGFTAEILYPNGEREYIEDLSSPANISCKGASSVIWHFSFTGDIPENCYFCYKCSFQEAVFEIEGQVVDEFHEAKGLLQTPVSFGGRRIVKLPEGIEGRRASLCLTTRLPVYKGILGACYIGSRQAIIDHIINNYYISVTTGLFMLITGIGTVFMRLFAGNRLFSKRIYSYMGALFFVSGMWLIVQSGSVPSFWGNLSSSHALEFISLMMICAPALLLVDESERHKFHKISELLLCAYIIYYIVSFFIVYGFGIDWMELLPVTYVMIGSLAIYIIATTLWIVFRDKELRAELKWMLRGYIFFLTGGLVEIILLLSAPQLQMGQCMAAGMIVFAVCTIIWSRKRLMIDVENMEKRRQQARLGKAFIDNASRDLIEPIDQIIDKSGNIRRRAIDTVVRTDAAQVRSKAIAIREQILSLTGKDDKGPDRDGRYRKGIYKNYIKSEIRNIIKDDKNESSANRAKAITKLIRDPWTGSEVERPSRLTRLWHFYLYLSGAMILMFIVAEALSHDNFSWGRMGETGLSERSLFLVTGTAMILFSFYSLATYIMSTHRHRLGRLYYLFIFLFMGGVHFLCRPEIRIGLVRSESVRDNIYLQSQLVAVSAAVILYGAFLRDFRKKDEKTEKHIIPMIGFISLPVGLLMQLFTPVPDICMGVAELFFAVCMLQKLFADRMNEDMDDRLTVGRANETAVFGYDLSHRVSNPLGDIGTICKRIAKEATQQDVLMDLGEIEIACKTLEKEITNIKEITLMN